VDCGEGRAKEEGKGSVPIVANLPNEHFKKSFARCVSKILLPTPFLPRDAMHPRY